MTDDRLLITDKKYWFIRYNRAMPKLPFNPYRKQLTVVALVTWLVFMELIMIVNPDFVKDVVWPNSYLPFFLLLFMSLFWWLWVFTGRWKRSLLWSLVVTVGCWLRVNQLDSLINIILLLSFGIVWEYYWHLARPSDSLFN